MMGLLAGALSLAAAVARADDQSQPENPREMFRILGVDDSYFGRLVDGQPIDAGEQETLLRVLFRLRTFPREDIARWALNPGELAEAIEEPEVARGSIYRLRGRVTDVEPIRIPRETAQRYELTRCFRCRLHLDAPPETADVYTEEVPATWQNGASPNATAGAFGVFLKLAGHVHLGEDRPLLTFAAPRLAWYPDNLLGKLGMDFGLLDSPQARKPFNPRNPEDREAFYQLLAAMGRATPDQLLQAAKEELPKTLAAWRSTDQQGREQYSVVPLFNEPGTQVGRLVDLFGTARLIEEVHLDPRLDADIIARFGFNHYYQVSLFTDDSQGNPLTFDIRELPKGMPFGNLPQYGETVRMAGFFFKTWSYRVPKMTDPTLDPGNPKTHQQLSPLLIGGSLTWYPAPQPADNMPANVLIAGLFLLFVVILWLMAWQNRRYEKKWLAEMEKRPKLDAGIELGQLGPPSGGRPDFERLAEMDRGPEDLAFGEKGLEPDKPFTFRPEP